MSNLVFRLPRYYQDSPQGVRAGAGAGGAGRALRVSESDTLAQLWVDTATWGLDLWGAVGGAALRPHSALQLPEEPHQGQAPGPGATTAEMLRSVVASFGFEPSQISVIEHPAEYQFEIVLSDLGRRAVGCERD